MDEAYGHVVAIAPWMTKTYFLSPPTRLNSMIMTSAFSDGWIKAGLPANEPEDISRAIATAALRPDLNGCTLWVSGGRFTEIENRFCTYEGRGHWLGKENNEDWEKGAEFLKAGYTLPEQLFHKGSPVKLIRNTSITIYLNFKKFYKIQ